MKKKFIWALISLYSLPVTAGVNLDASIYDANGQLVNQATSHLNDEVKFNSVYVSGEAFKLKVLGSILDGEKEQYYVGVTYSRSDSMNVVNKANILILPNSEICLPLSDVTKPKHYMIKTYNDESMEKLCLSVNTPNLNANQFK